MKRCIVLPLLGTLGFALVAALVLVHIADAPSDVSETPHADIHPDAAMIERGSYLAAASDCAGCHSVPGQPPYGGGRKFDLPFGTIYGSNITPDVRYGIGSWTDAEFIAAMYRGIAKDRHHLYPAFPYTSYTKMPISDVLAIKAYLFSLKSVSVPAPTNKVTFPFNQTWGIAYWNLLFNSKKRFRPDPSHTERVNRGAYLVEGPGHCSLCHTPLNIAFAPRAGKEMAGTIVEGMRAYNISPDPKWGIGGWSDADLVNYLKHGFANNHGAAGGTMAEVVENSSAFMTDNDLLAIGAYLRQLPAQPGTVDQREPSSNSVRLAPASVELDAGAKIFVGACIGCHGLHGPYTARGSNLLGHPSVSDPTAQNAIYIMLHGVDLNTPKGRIYMPSFASSYSDEEIAEVLTYSGDTFGTGALRVIAEMVRTARH